MEQLRNFGDDRQLAQCVYCGDVTETRDHVPSRVLLDEPYPANLPVVPACRRCNEGFSADEEYVACLIECTLSGSARPAAIKRSKIKRTLTERPALSARLEGARCETDGRTHFAIEAPRVRTLLLKLARGHAAFELNEPRQEEPTRLTYVPIAQLGAEDRVRFEREPAPELWPEVGSRAMQRLAASERGAAEWIVVQPGRYRYLAVADRTTFVRIVLSEYLACEIEWTREDV